MDPELFIAVLRQAFAEITEPRFYETERGYQGELLAQLRMKQPIPAMPMDAIFEQEHQKVIKHHGIKSRPDIILHEPFDPERHAGRYDGNHVVIELKRRASRGKAADDFDSIGVMFDRLNYSFGVFVNVDSKTTFANIVPPRLRRHVLCFAVSLNEQSAVNIVEEPPVP